MSWIEWCPLCHEYILTTGQQRENKPCSKCQEERGEVIKDAITKEDYNG